MGAGQRERPEKNRHIAYVPSIDGLRAVSIVLVVLFHAYPASAPGGFIGVDVFFVISGYLISSIIFASLREGRFSFVEFYQRRVLRLFPALAVTLAGTLALGLVFMTSAELRELAAHVVAGAGFFSNILLVLQAGYFDTDAALKPLLHLWSLGVEEQFYVVWPPLVVLATRLRFMRAAILVVLAASFVVNIDKVSHFFLPAAFFLPHARFWELMLGAALAYDREYGLLPHGSALRLRFPPVLLATAGVALLAIGVVLIDPTRLFPGWWALLPTLGTVLIVASGPASYVNRALAHRWLVALGKISYPLYLTHWPLLVFWRMLDAGSHPAIPAVIVAVSVVLSALIHLCLELPAKKMPRMAMTATLAGIVAAIGIAALIENRTEIVPARVRDPEKILDAARDLPTRWRQTHCFIDSIKEVVHAPECVDPPEAGKELIVLWGDSFAAQLYPGLHTAQERGAAVRVAQFSEGSCPPILGYARFRPACPQINERVFAEIVRLKPRVVVVAGDWVDDHRVGPFAEDLAASLVALRRAGVANIVLVGVFPRWHLPLPRAAVNIQRGEGVIAVRERMQPRDTSEVERELEKVARDAGVTLFRPKDALCNADGCITVVQDGEGARHLTFFDIAHLTDYGSQFMVGAMATLLGLDPQAAGAVHPAGKARQDTPGVPLAPRLQ